MTKLCTFNGATLSSALQKIACQFNTITIINLKNSLESFIYKYFGE